MNGFLLVWAIAAVIAIIILMAKVIRDHRKQATKKNEENNE